jgi:hypothetical protein
MSRLIAILLATSFATGCSVGVTKRTRIESAGVKTGDSLTLASAVVYECEPRDTTSEFWLSAAKKKRCLKSSTSVTRYDKVLGNVASGASARISSIKYINGIDTVFHLAYLQVAGIDGQLIVYDFDLPNLLQAPQDGR